jgi:hypothetical protein
MKDSFSRQFLLAFLVFFLTPGCFAGTFYANSCSYADVNDCINGSGVNTCHAGSSTGAQGTHTAVKGDVINLPAGTCTWASNLSISVSITIQGNGTPNTLPSQLGSGTLNTIITDNAGNSAPLFQIEIGYNSGALFRLSTIDIEPESASTNLFSPVSIAGTCTSSGCPNVRVDNIGFGLSTSFSSGNDGAGKCAWLIRSDGVFGVLDHDSEGTANWPDFVNPSLSAYLGVGAYGDNSWAQPDTFGTASALYMENNVLYTQTAFVDTEIAPVGGGVGGGRYVARFNHVTTNAAFGMFGNHGLDTDGRPQSGRTEEVYGNTVTIIPASGSSGTLAGIRGGTEIVFGNTVSDGSGYWINYFVSLATYRTVFTGSNGWGACGGSGAYDTNDGTVYASGTLTSASGGGGNAIVANDTSKSSTTNEWAPSGAPYSFYDVTQGFWMQIASNTSNSLTTRSEIPEQESTANSGNSYEILRATVCADQPGRGQGNYVSGSTPSPTGSLAQALDPIYEWDDTAGLLGQSANVGTVDSGQTIANRDWYTDNSLGTPKAQTSATSPFNGTGGVGFGTLARRPTTCTPRVGYFATDQGSWNTSGNGFGQGELFVCAAANTWTLDYTPYTYPHPLTTGSAGETPASPRNLTGTPQPN